MTQNKQHETQAHQQDEADIADLTDAEIAEAEASDQEAKAAQDAAKEAEPDRAEQLAQELASTRDQLLRTVAELDNTRKRFERDREQDRKFGQSNFAKDMVTVADNLRRALESVPESAADNEAVKALVEGVEMTERSLLSALEKHGVQRVSPAAGEPFDYNQHQAMFELENTGHPAGSVVQVLQPGYIIHERLLRPAMVGVAKGEPTAKPQRVDTSA